MLGDNIVLTKIWEDGFEAFYMIAVECYTPTVHVVSRTYVSNDNAEALIQGLNELIAGTCDNFQWSSNGVGDSLVSFFFSRFDNRGNISIETTVKNVEMPDVRGHYECRFCVCTELQPLCEFVRRLPGLQRKGNIGYKVYLAEKCTPDMSTAAVLTEG